MKSGNFDNHSKYSLSKVNISRAQKFWERSSQSTFFTNPNQISLFENKIDWWIASKGSEELCMWSVCCSPIKKVFLPLFSYYFGPIWSNSFLEISNHSKLNSSIKIYDLFFREFINTYKNFIFQTHYDEHDLRFFLWWNDVNKKKFSIKPKYSSVIDQLDKEKENNIFLNFRELRRRMARRAQKNKNIMETNEFNYNEITQLYKKTLKNKNQKVNKDILKKIKLFFNLCKKGEGKMLGYREKVNKKLISFILLIFSKHSANLILNLSANEWKQSGITALNMLEAIKYSKKTGKKIFDFNGANSPVGADDKQSYGGKYKLYFEVEFSNKSS